MAVAKAVSKQRERLLAAQASRAELKLAAERREVLPVPVAEEAWGRLLVNFRARMMALPSKVSFQLVACNSMAEVHAILEKEIHSALRELAEGKWLEDPASSPPAPAKRRVAAPPDRGPRRGRSEHKGRGSKK